MRIFTYMVFETEHNPISAMLIPFKAQLIKLEAAKKWGIDLSGLMASERKLLSLFGAMVMGTLKDPENWKVSDIRQVYNPYVDQWESFWNKWRDSIHSSRFLALNDLGIDIIHFENPYEELLLDLLGFIYGPELRTEASSFLWENDSMIYIYKDRAKKDLRATRDWAHHFKENYDKPDTKVSLN